MSGGKKLPADFNAKEMVEDKEPPQKISSIDFSICSGEEIVKNAVMEVQRDDMYTSVPTAPGQASIREAAPNGPLDRRMGTTNKDSKCKTCDEYLTECSGHFGHLRLTLPVFHQGYFKAIIACLNCICKTCSRLLLSGDEKASTVAYFRKVCASTGVIVMNTRLCLYRASACSDTRIGSDESFRFVPCLGYLHYLPDVGRRGACKHKYTTTIFDAQTLTLNPKP